MLVEQENNLDKIISMLFALSFLVHALDSPIPGINYGEILLLITSGIIIIKHFKTPLRFHAVNKGMIGFYLAFVCLTLLCVIFQTVFSLEQFAIRAARWGVYVFTAALLGQYLSFKYLKKALIILATLSSIFLIIQVISFKVFGTIISIPTSGDVIGVSIEGKYINGVRVKSIYRFSSIFSEPAHFSYYGILALSILLFYRENLSFKVGELAEVAVIVSALIASSSTYAIALLAITFVLFVMRFVESVGVSNKTLNWMFLGIICLIVICIVFKNTELGEYLWRKLSTVGTASRTRFAWHEAESFSPFQKVFGLGVGNEEYYFEKVLGKKLGYMNSVSLSFLYCGGMGVCMLLLLYARLIGTTDKCGRILMWLFITITIFSTALVSMTMTIYTTVVALGSKEKSWVNQ